MGNFIASNLLTWGLSLLTSEAFVNFAKEHVERLMNEQMKSDDKHNIVKTLALGYGEQYSDNIIDIAIKILVEITKGRI